MTCAARPPRFLRSGLNNIGDSWSSTLGHHHQSGVAHITRVISSLEEVIEKLMKCGFARCDLCDRHCCRGVDFPARTVVLTVADARTGSGWRPLSASELQQMTGRAGRRSRDNVGFVIVAPGVHQEPQRIAELLRARPDPLVSQFRATYTTLLNLLDAYGNFAQVREIAERSFAHREAALQITQLEKVQSESTERIKQRLREVGCELPLSVVIGFERLISARSRLQESRPHTRAEVVHGWLDEVVQPGRVVGIGRSGRRLVLITEKRGGNVRGIREDGRSGSFALERIGRVYAPSSRARGSCLGNLHDVRERGKELLVLNHGCARRKQKRTTRSAARRSHRWILPAHSALKKNCVAPRRLSVWLTCGPRTRDATKGKNARRVGPVFNVRESRRTGYLNFERRQL